MNFPRRRPSRQQGPAKPITPEQLEKLLKGREAFARKKARAAAPITAVLPRVRVLSLGGKPWLVGELRLYDLADLQQWLEEQVPDPLDGLPPIGDPGRDAALRAAWIPCREWPPKLGTDEAWPLMVSVPGLVMFVAVCLRRCRPETTHKEAKQCAEAMSAAEWATLRRVAWGHAPWRVIYSELGPGREPAGAMDWVEAAAELAERYGWTPETIGNLTISQWCGFRAGRADVYRGMERMPGESMRETRDRERALFGAIAPEPGP